MFREIFFGGAEQDVSLTQLLLFALPSFNTKLINNKLRYTRLHIVVVYRIA